MPDTITKSIGSGKDYADPSAWEADFGSGTVYPNGDETAVGEVYDETIDGQCIINGTPRPDVIILRPATGEGHDGTANNGGATLRVDTNNQDVVNVNQGSAPVTVSGMLVTENRALTPLRAGIVAKQSFIWLLIPKYSKIRRFYIQAPQAGRQRNADV